MHFGIRVNLGQFLQQLLQVLLVGMTLGMMRNVVPALAESEFGVPRGSFMLLTAFVVAFGFVKGTMNFVAGRMAERLGRKQVLSIGWLIALPIAPMIYFATSWSWVVAATVLLGINQGLTWSMTQTAKLDFTRADQRGLVIGLNEFAGYVGVAIAGVATGYLASALGPREGLLWFGIAVVGLATLMSWLAVAETLPWARHEVKRHASGPAQALRPRYPKTVSAQPSTSEMFALMSWQDRRMAAICQAGLVEKFVDALVWAFWPIYLHQQGVGLPAIGWIVGAYGFTWGGAQLFTGKLSDRFGRHLMNTWGMWICAVGVALMPFGAGAAWWSIAAAIAGLGMAMLYPNLSAAVADIAHPNWRASAIGIYRFWRDLGYGIGALGLGAAAALGGRLEAASWFVAIAMLVSGALLYHWGEETHPRLNPAA
ncbi:MAG: MFS transporter [Burkholderiales bacterium]|nr:MFS transporter [Burkholderiales bacterium]